MAWDSNRRGLTAKRTPPPITSAAWILAARRFLRCLTYRPKRLGTAHRASFLTDRPRETLRFRALGNTSKYAPPGKGMKALPRITRRPVNPLEEKRRRDRTIGFLVATELSAMLWAGLFLMLGHL
ncbi:hypothetical protein AM571_PC02044 (plasmid) [Rhizobium etli 8C-3]|uniref:Uncharacterized protein n=1 Tax=Rhizobium etli 8C-3 TaxID=538025 RepID=A0A1L5PI19_RHIET|nr:hypothetical protein AM571_PC02044 [Rhizobium etli 8C-3]